MFSVIIPTIWSPAIEKIDDLIQNLNSSHLVSEIILINNNPTKYSNRYRILSKVRELQFNNIYVNPAWNIGVEFSLNEFIALMNDDIHFNTEVFDFINDKLKEDDIRIIGVSKSSYSREEDSDFYLQKISVRNRGWGCLIFLKKSFYTPIPADLKIHFGDDYLIQQMSGYVWKLEGLKISSPISVSVSSNPELERIIFEDNQNSLKYNLPWSNDY